VRDGAAVCAGGRLVVRDYDVLGKSPHMVIPLADGRTAFVSDTDSDAVAAIDLESGAVKLIGVRRAAFFGIVSIANCSVHHAHGAVTIGSETSGWIRNLVASNITCDGTQMGVRIKSRRGRGGGVEDVRFDNWTLRNVGTAINVTNYYLMEGEKPATEPEPVSKRTPVFRNIAINNMTVDHARVEVDIEGLPEMNITGLRISDLIASSQVEGVPDGRARAASRAD
jgi:polygalacturonase